MDAPETRRRARRAARYACAASDEAGVLLEIAPEGWLQLTYDSGVPSLRLLLGFRPDSGDVGGGNNPLSQAVMVHSTSQRQITRPLLARSCRDCIRRLRSPNSRCRAQGLFER